MLFNSIDFAIFLPIIFAGYWFVFGKNLRWQNLFITLASCVFYGWWDWRFLGLLLFSSFVDFFVGIALGKTDDERRRKILLTVSIVCNLGLLGFFKYYNFFVANFVEAFSFFGQKLEVSTLKVVLPVGISFYTFQALSYGIDIYRRKLEPTSDPIAYLAFISFFPQLVAGPIERATNLLPQFQRNRHFDEAKAADGIRQMLWGLFKKVVVADNCAIGVNHIFDNQEYYSGGVLLLGGVLFAVQIYCDFSGYSDIAIGCARLFGFDLMRNFAYPYFSRDMAEFWRRWHISLSTWFRDYLYFPLGGSQGSLARTVRNTFIIFVVSGFWHGANWTFVAWGFLNACYFLPLLLSNSNRKNLDIAGQNSFFPSISEVFQILPTFLLTVIAWVFFRAANISEAFQYLKNLFGGLFIWESWNFAGAYLTQTLGWATVFFTLFMFAVEWVQRREQHGLQMNPTRISSPVRWTIYLILTFCVVVFGAFGKPEFIYFQF